MFHNSAVEMACNSTFLLLRASKSVVLDLLFAHENAIS